MREDVERGTEYLDELAKKYPLDLTRVVVIGHSAGGQLALWLAAQHKMALRGAVSLAGVLDLRRAWELHLSNNVVEELLGGSPGQQAERYRQASPIELIAARRGGAFGAWSERRHCTDRDEPPISRQRQRRPATMPD